jgi:prepilin peptidase CpaA
MGSLVLGLLLVAASVSDVRSRRIPNWLTATLAVSGTVYAFSTMPPPEAAVHVMGGVVVGLVLWLPFWFLRLLGAGDVKLAAAAGAWLGAGGAVEAALFGALVGGVLGVASLVRAYGARGAVTRFTAWVLTSGMTRALAPEATPQERRIPYGVALAAGAAIAAWFPGIL